MNQSSKLSGPRPPLSDEEWTHRKQKGLCMYCADPTHSVEDCPRKLAHLARISALHFAPSNPHSDLPESENYQTQAPTR